MLSAVRFLFAWANAPFTLAAGVGALFSLLQLTGVLGLIAGSGGGDSDADAGVDHDVDVDQDVDGDASHDADEDHDANHDHAHGAHNRGLAVAALAPLGLGQIPLSLIWQTFCLVFAGTGLLLNSHYLAAGGQPPSYTLAWTAPASILAGYFGVAGVAKVLGPLLSSKGQEATSRAQLVGQIGVVISSQVDRAFGEVRIRDKTGHDIRLVCKLADTAKRAPREQEQVVVVDYEPERGELFVEPLDLEERREQGQRLS